MKRAVCPPASQNQLLCSACPCEVRLDRTPFLPVSPPQGFSSLRLRPIRTLSSALEQLRGCRVVGVIEKVSKRALCVGGDGVCDWGDGWAERAATPRPSEETGKGAGVQLCPVAPPLPQHAPVRPWEGGWEPNGQTAPSHSPPARTQETAPSGMRDRSHGRSGARGILPHTAHSHFPQVPSPHSLCTPGLQPSPPPSTAKKFPWREGAHPQKPVLRVSQPARASSRAWQLCPLSWPHPPPHPLWALSLHAGRQGERT